MRVVFFGTPSFVIPVAKSLKDHFDLEAVVTTPDQPAGRKQTLTPPPVKIWATDNGIPIFQPQSLNDKMIAQLTLMSPDLFVVASYGKLLPHTILRIPKHQVINIHPSRLPLLRGPSPIQTAILQGLTNSAVTILVMDDQMDHGPILHTDAFPLYAHETFLDIAQKSFSFASIGLPDVLKAYASGFLQAGPQNDEEATYCRRITREDGFIDLDSPPPHQQFDRMVRAYYPWPNVWTKVKMNNETVKMIKFLPKNQIQLEGKKPVDVETFDRGYPQLKEKIEKLYK